MEKESEKLSESKIKTLINGISELPTLPTVVYEVMDLINNGNSSVAKITDIISHDQSITSKTLRVVNSAFYGFPKKITTINHAIVILGFNEIKNLILSTSVFDMFDDEETKESEHFNRNEFWKHSIACGTAGKILAKSFRYRISGEVFVAGILHDIGKVIFDKYMHNDFLTAIKISNEKKIPIHIAENEVFGLNHSDIGKLLLKHWKLPDHVVEVVNLHHKPELAEINPELTSIINLADNLCKRNHIGNSGDNIEYEINPYVWDLLKHKKLDLNATDMDKFSFDLNTELEKSNTFMLMSESTKQNSNE